MGPRKSFYRRSFFRTIKFLIGIQLKLPTIAWLLLLISGCASDLQITVTSGTATTATTNTSSAQNLLAAAAKAGHVSFQSKNFYTLFNPNLATRCAGDAHTYYDPVTLASDGTPLPFPINLIDNSTTIKPAFIKNVSVDVTDSNLLLPTNLAYSCSYGSSTQVPPPSNCATFDNVENKILSLATAVSSISVPNNNIILNGGAPQISPYLLSSGNQIILANASQGTYTIALPPAEQNLDKVVFIQKTDASANAVKITATSTNTVVDTATTTYSLTSKNQYVALKATARSPTLTPANYWLDMGTFTQTTLSSNYTLAATPAANQELSIDATNGNIALTLPAASLYLGKIILIKRTDAATESYNVTVMLNGSDKIKDRNGTPAAAPYYVTTKSPILALIALYNATDNSYYWSTQGPEPVATATPYSIVTGNQVVLVDATNGDLTLNLPPATVNAGKTLLIQRLDSSSHTVTLNPLSPDLIDSLTSTTLTTANPALTLLSSLNTSCFTGIYCWKTTTGINYRAVAGYNTGYYTALDSACVQGGPISSTDPAVNSLYVGGIYFDIDRNQLGSNENLLLNLTFFPLNETQTRLNQTSLSIQEVANIKVHLVKTGQSGDVIRSITQPRILTYASTSQFPQTVQNLAIISAPGGQIQQQQIFIPLSIDPGIDRIHVQRYSGSMIFIDATLYRMGSR